ncbi:MAG: DUF2917 domain-containing protein [Ramlibacter sp.]|nr:DUF2917 domain-containing protein [Ramlibacter sp.]
MAPQMLPQTQQSLPARALPGTWRLVAGRALTLQPREPGLLRVAHGQMWVTYDGPHGGPANDLGDHVIGAGGHLRLRAGERVVVEPWDGQSSAYFSWDPLPVRTGLDALRTARVLLPLSDLRLALGLAAAAAARLASGLAGLAGDLITGRCREGLADCAPP